MEQRLLTKTPGFTLMHQDLVLREAAKVNSLHVFPYSFDYLHVKDTQRYHIRFNIYLNSITCKISSYHIQQHQIRQLSMRKSRSRYRGFIAKSIEWERPPGRRRDWLLPGKIPTRLGSLGLKNIESLSPNRTVRLQIKAVPHWIINCLMRHHL